MTGGNDEGLKLPPMKDVLWAAECYRGYMRQVVTSPPSLRVIPRQIADFAIAMATDVVVIERAHHPGLRGNKSSAHPP